MYNDGTSEEKTFEDSDALDNFLLSVMLDIGEDGPIESIEIVEGEEDGDYVS